MIFSMSILGCNTLSHVYIYFSWNLVAVSLMILFIFALIIYLIGFDLKEDLDFWFQGS